MDFIMMFKRIIKFAKIIYYDVEIGSFTITNINTPNTFSLKW